MIDRAYFRLRSRQFDYIRRELAMVEWLRMRIGDDCYVSWSAGKDSTVVAHAARTIRPSVPILMVDPGVPIHWTEHDRLSMLDRANNWNLRIFAWDKFSRPEVSAAADEGAYRKAVHADQFAELTEFAQRMNLTRRITGMRAAESKARSTFLYATKGETKRTLQPIWNWSTEDVWTYTVRHDLPWLSIYDHLGPEARNGLIGKNGREHGRMVFLKRYYPEAFRRACELFDAREHV